MGSDTRRRWLWALVAVQAVLVLPVVFIWLGPAQEAVDAAPDANIGAGLIGLYLLAFGLPWSVFVCLLDNRYELFDSALGNLVVAGPAVFNLALTAGLLWWSGRHPVVESDWQIEEYDPDEEEEEEEEEAEEEADRAR
ncbi:hypothetical protein [Actinoplanes aureus]|uniref:Uncharacterized protein n=1 Tax=Actinoplanes aureus TaxID=2792083 RepID=A0A931CG65_9ACTN|nr:hypothetical protein [Actinoplanes aureus]MBG0567392.1 hypothetical protein [Actinoplanes aureus]